MDVFLLDYLVLFVGVAMIGRSYLVWRRTGANPYALGSGDSALDHIGRLFRVLVALIVGVIVLHAWLPAAYDLLMPIGWLERPWLDVVGVALLGFAFLWIVAAQGQMGDAWRIGIDAATRTELVERGPFRVSRNPIFLGMRALLLGLFFIVPNALTLAVWLLGDTLLQIQVRLEEKHLRRLHGNAYITYQRRVRRWL